MLQNTDPAEVFARNIANYDHVRIGYEPRFVQQILEDSGLADASKKTRLQIMDVGAGTGQLGSTFLGLGHDVAFVEPNSNAVSYLQHKYGKEPHAKIIQARAEKITGAPDQSAHAIVMGDAAHWVNESCLPEFRRILKPNGKMILLARTFSQESPITHKLHELLLAHCIEYRLSPSQLIRDFSNARKRYGRHIIHEEDNSWRGLATVKTYSQDEFVDFLRSLSFTANALEKDEASFRKDIIAPLWDFAASEDLLTRDGRLRLPYEIQALHGAPRTRILTKSHLNGVGH